MRHTSSVAVALLMVMVCAAASGTVDAALRVYNGIEAGANITVTTPGCCNNCALIPGRVCAAVCLPCSVVIKSNTIVTLGPRAGPYPLTSLRVQVHGTGLNNCVPECDLKYLTATALLRVRPGDCGAASPKGIPGVVFDGSNRYDTCMQLCELL